MFSVASVLAAAYGWLLVKLQYRLKLSGKRDQVRLDLLFPVKSILLYGYTKPRRSNI